jgi:hypothetical protein
MSTQIQITPKSGLTVGSTAIASGTVGRVLFQGTGNVLQQDSGLAWDNTTKVLTVGTYTNPNTKLTVTGTTFGSYISGNTGIYAQTNTTTGTLYAIDCLGRALSGANTSFGIRAASDTGGVGSINYGGRFSATNGTTNYAGYFDATGGTNNYALVTQRGFSGFNKTDPAAIVDIKAQGALSTDIALRVRNSADTANLFEVRGNGHSVFSAGNPVFIGFGAGSTAQGHLLNMRFGLSTSTPFAYFDNASFNLDIDRFCNVKLGFGLIDANSQHSIALGLGIVPSSRNYQQTVAFWTAISQGTNDSGFAQSGADTAGNNSVYTNYYGKNIVLGGTTQGNGKNVFVMLNGTVPSSNIANGGQLYVEGGALKFRGSSGTISTVAPA